MGLIRVIGQADVLFQFGPAGSGWEPLAGNWNDEGGDSIGAFDPSTNVYRLRNSNTEGQADVLAQFGPRGSGYIPIAGNWDGIDGDTRGGFDPGTSVFRLRNTNDSGPSDQLFQFGPRNSGWLPIVGDWDNDGDDTIGLYDPATGVFRLRNSHSGGQADVLFQFGPRNSGWLVVSGDFNNDGLDTVGLFDAGSIVDERNPAGDGALGFLWKPISDNTGRLVVLLPAYEFFTETEPRVVAVEIHTDSPPSEATFVERGVYTGDSNPNRPTYRYTRSGQSYEQEFGSVWLMVFESNGDITGFFIPQPGSRLD